MASPLSRSAISSSTGPYRGPAGGSNPPWRGRLNPGGVRSEGPSRAVLKLAVAAPVEVGGGRVEGMPSSGFDSQEECNAVPVNLEGLLIATGGSPPGVFR